MSKQDEGYGFYFTRETAKATRSVFRADPDLPLPELLEEFAFFLKSCGYHFHGELDIVEYELPEVPNE